MTHLFDDWRFYIVLYIILSGIWGVLAKSASNRIDVLTQTFVATMGASLVVIAATFRSLQWQSTLGISIATIAGILGGFSTIIFYAALRRAPANIVIPLSSLYIVLTVILSFFFLRETIHLKQFAGILLGLLAIFLIIS